jgi:hypothetical protein
MIQLYIFIRVFQNFKLFMSYFWYFSDMGKTYPTASDIKTNYKIKAHIEMKCKEKGAAQHLKRSKLRNRQVLQDFSF